MLPGGKLSDLLGRALRSCQCLLFPKPVIQITKNRTKSGSASGHKQPRKRLLEPELLTHTYPPFAVTLVTRVRPENRYDLPIDWESANE